MTPTIQLMDTTPASEKAASILRAMQASGAKASHAWDDDGQHIEYDPAVVLYPTPIAVVSVLDTDYTLIGQASTGGA